jgi:hypothetical protein
MRKAVLIDHGDRRENVQLVRIPAVELFEKIDALLQLASRQLE